jgi:hypothetical protein
MTLLVPLAMAVLLLAGIRRTYKRAHPLVHCGCGTFLGRAPRVAPGSRCAQCQWHAERDAQHARESEAWQRKADREYAAAEEARRDGRFPVRRAGTFGRIGGAFVLDGWVFEDPRAATDAGGSAATAAQLLTLDRWSLVYGWRLEELHAEAHGAFCTCLD